MRQHLVSAVLCIALQAQAQAESAQVIRVAGDDYCPLACNPASGQQGILIDITEQVLALGGWRMEYVYLPWQRAIRRFEQGEIDLLPGVPREGSRELETARFNPEPIANPPMCFYTRSGSRWRFQGTQSLESGRLAVIAGYYYWPELRQYMEQHRADGRIKTLASDRAVELALLGLKNRRYDYFTETRPVVEYQIRNLKLESSVREAGCEFNFPLYMSWRPNLANLDQLVEHWSSHYPAFIDSPNGQQLLQHYKLNRNALLDDADTP